MLHRRSFVVQLTLLALSGCRRPALLGPAAPDTVTEFAGRGLLLQAGGHSAVIAHEAIPGYMEAMTMELTVGEPRELRGLAPGDVIRFHLCVTADRSWIDRIEKVGEAPLPAVADSAPARDLRPGDPVPDCALIDSTGRSFQVSDLRGSVTVVSFMFTRCPLPDFCPRLSSRLTELQQLLQREQGLAPWHLLSISFDPDYDTPARLAAYATACHADPAAWTVASGDAEDVIAFGAVFGLVVSRERGQLTHNLRTAVLDSSGRLRKIYNGSAWTAQEMAEEMRQAMAA